MSDKYRCQFTAEPAFVAQIRSIFTYKNEDDAHVLNVGHIHPQDFFEDDVFKEEIQASGLSQTASLQR